MTPRWLLCAVVGLAAPMVHAQTAPVAAQGEEYAQDSESDEDTLPLAPSAPPALPQESPTAKPFADAVWTSGHWYWDESQWRYKPGAWVARMPGYQFINGYWTQEGSSWRWIPGGWARPGSSDVEIPTEVTNEDIASTQAPPPVREETPPPSPAGNYEWAPGYWYWSGADWDWIDGSWVLPPRPGLVYVTPRWVQRGPSWYFVGGGWAVRGSYNVVIPEYRHAAIAVRWGHPNYFLYSWRRYPTVTHYSYYGPRYYSGPSRFGGGGYHPASSPAPGRVFMGHGGYSGPPRQSGYHGGYHSAPPPSHGGGGHGASPVHSGGPNGGGGHHH